MLGPIPQPKQTLFQLFSEAGFEAVRARLTEEISATFEKRIQSLLRKVDELTASRKYWEDLAKTWCATADRKDKAIADLTELVEDVRTKRNHYADRTMKTELDLKTSRQIVAEQDKRIETLHSGRKYYAEKAECSEKELREVRVQRNHQTVRALNAEKEIASLRYEVHGHGLDRQRRLNAEELTRQLHEDSQKQAKQIKAMTIIVDRFCGSGAVSRCLNDPDSIK